MGFFKAVGGFLSGLFGGGGGGGGGSHSTSSTVYEPDRVRAAEIEQETKLRLANMEKERIELMKQARLDILECETQSKIALEQAQAQGLAVMAQTILTMQDKLNEVAEKRLLIIEKASLQVIREIEAVYDELGMKIQEDDDKYNTEKLPELLGILGRYEEGSPAHQLYTKRIEADMDMQVKYCMQQLDAIAARQSQVINAFLSSKERIVEQTGQITAGMLEAIQQKVLALGESGGAGGGTPTALPQGGQLALPQDLEH